MEGQVPDSLDRLPFGHPPNIIVYWDFSNTSFEDVTTWEITSQPQIQRAIEVFTLAKIGNNIFFQLNRVLN
jgi:hypothetical protein